MQRGSGFRIKKNEASPISILRYLVNLVSFQIENAKLNARRRLRIFGWLGCYQRLSKDYEYLVPYAENWIRLAGLHIALRKVCR